MTCHYSWLTYLNKFGAEIGVLRVVLVTDHQDDYGDNIHKSRILKNTRGKPEEDI